MANELPSRLPFSERRVNRAVIPPCVDCGCADAVVATRTPYVLYIRCPRCSHVWSIPKPGQQDYGS